MDKIFKTQFLKVETSKAVKTQDKKALVNIAKELGVELTHEFDALATSIFGKLKEIRNGLSKSILTNR